MAIISKITALLLVFISSAYAADQTDEFYRGVRASGMGDAFTAIADDHDAVFYNPAGLAFNRDIDFVLFNPKVDVSQDAVTSTSALKNTASSGLSNSNASQYFGKNIYGSGTIFPSVYLPGFVLGYYASGSMHAVAQNLSLPSVNASYFLDRGVVGGYGFETRGLAKRQYLRFGVSVKWLTRTGYDGSIPITSLVDPTSAYLSTLKSGPATGWGVTPGIQYEFVLGRRDSFILASAWRDIGDTSFGNTLDSAPPPPIRNNLTAGGAYVHYFNGAFDHSSNIKITGEMQHLAESDMDPVLKMHLGAELQISMLSLQGGVNQDCLTAGVGLNLGFIKVSAVTYGVEDQELAFMDRERRYMAQVEINLELFDKTSRRKSQEDQRKRPRDYD